MAFRIVGSALPAYAVNFEVRVGEAEPDKFMGGIGQGVVEIGKIERTSVFSWRAPVIIPYIGTYFDNICRRNGSRHHDHF